MYGDVNGNDSQRHSAGKQIDGYLIMFIHRVGKRFVSNTLPAIYSFKKYKLSYSLFFIRKQKIYMCGFVNVSSTINSSEYENEEDRNKKL